MSCLLNQSTNPLSTTSFQLRDTILKDARSAHVDTIDTVRSFISILRLAIQRVIFFVNHWQLR
jgi:hypothetical protein